MACGVSDWFDDPEPTFTALTPALADLQVLLLDLLSGEVPAELAFHRFADLQVAASLIQAGWPTAADLAPTEIRATLEAHLAPRPQTSRGRRPAATTADTTSATPWHTPPGDARATAALLSAAYHLLAQDPAEPRSTMPRLLRHLPTRNDLRWGEPGTSWRTRLLPPSDTRSIRSSDTSSPQTGSGKELRRCGSTGQVPPGSSSPPPTASKTSYSLPSTSRRDCPPPGCLPPTSETPCPPCRQPLPPAGSPRSPGPSNQQPELPGSGSIPRHPHFLDHPGAPAGQTTGPSPRPERSRPSDHPHTACPPHPRPGEGRLPGPTHAVRQLSSMTQHGASFVSSTTRAEAGCRPIELAKPHPLSSGAASPEASFSSRRSSDRRCPHLIDS